MESYLIIQIPILGQGPRFVDDGGWYAKMPDSDFLV